MVDREKVIKGLGCCISGNTAICKRVGCPYAEEHDGIGDTCIDHLMADALALLKAQEPVEPVRKPEIFDSLYFCGKCSAKVGFQIRKDDSWRFKCNFCPNCGQAVKWE